MISVPLHKFYLPWLLALAAASREPLAPDAVLVLRFQGLELPALQLALAVAGVLMARPLAPRRNQERGVWRQLLITLIMLVVAVAWVTDSRPGVLFTFVVSIGLGFSGYALIELAGTEIETFIKRIFASATSLLPGKRSGDRVGDQEGEE